MPSIKMDNGVNAEDLEAAIAAENGTATPAPVEKEAPAPKAKASKTESKTSE